MVSRLADVERTPATRRLFLRGLAGALTVGAAAPARLLAGPREERLLLNDLRLTTRTRSPFHVISAFRSPRTNSMLRECGRGVAKGSLHLQGRAIDVRLADVSSVSLRDAALELERGGVGYYRGPDFVHVDTGRVRRW